MKRWALVSGIVAGALLLAALGFVALLSNTSCASLTLERMEDGAASPTPPTPVPLDEARVRNEAPALAKLLDRAVDEGRATEDHERYARAMYQYLQEQGATRGAVEWRGVPLRVLLAVC